MRRLLPLCCSLLTVSALLLQSRAAAAAPCLLEPCGPLYAQSAQPAPQPEPGPATPAADPERPRLLRVAMGGVVTGLVFDLLGATAFGIGAALTNSNLGAGLLTANTGAGLLTIGSLISTSALTHRHRAFAAAGYELRSGPMAWAWVLTTLSVLTYFGSIPLAMAAQDEGSLGMALGSVGLWGLAAIFETTNLAFVRPKWVRMLASAQKVRPVTATKLRFYPTIAAYKDAATGAGTYVFGVGVAY